MGLSGEANAIRHSYDPALAGAIVGAGNSIISQGFSGADGNNWNGSKINWGQVGINGVTGAITGFVGGQIAGKLSPYISKYVSDLIPVGPVVQDMVTNSAVSATTGFVVNTGWAKLNGDSWADALDQGWEGAKVGAVTGGATGIISGFQRAQAKDVNWLTGKNSTPKNSVYNLTPDPNGDNVTLYRGTTGSEANNNKPLFMTDDPNYAEQYILNGGKIEQITIPRSTLNLMYHNGVLTYATGQYYNSYITAKEYIFSPSIKYLFNLK